MGFSSDISGGFSRPRIGYTWLNFGLGMRVARTTSLSTSFCSSSSSSCFSLLPSSSSPSPSSFSSFYSSSSSSLIFTQSVTRCIHSIVEPLSKHPLSGLTERDSYLALAISGHHYHQLSGHNYHHRCLCQTLLLPPSSPARRLNGELLVPDPHLQAPTKQHHESRPLFGSDPQFLVMVSRHP